MSGLVLVDPARINASDVEDLYFQSVDRADHHTAFLALLALEYGYPSEPWLACEQHIPPKVNEGPRTYSHDGQALTIGEWSRVTGLHPTVITGRIKLGWDMSRVLTAPVRRAAA